MNFDKYNLVIFDLDNTLYEENNYLFKSYQAIATYLSKKDKNLSEGLLLSFLKEEFISSGRNNILNKLFENLKNDKSTIIMVRPHPGDSLNQEILSSDYPSKNFMCSTNSLFEDLMISDIIVVLPLSTIAAEAIIFDKSLILVNTVDDDDKKFDLNFQHLLNNNLAKSSSIKNLISTIDIILDKKIDSNNISSRENFLNDFFNFDKKIDFVYQIKNLLKIEN